MGELVCLRLVYAPQFLEAGTIVGPCGDYDDIEAWTVLGVWVVSVYGLGHIVEFPCNGLGVGLEFSVLNEATTDDACWVVSFKHGVPYKECPEGFRRFIVDSVTSSWREPLVGFCILLGGFWLDYNLWSWVRGCGGCW